MAIYIMFDKDTSPLEAIKLSNEITYGEKWTIFLGTFALVIVLYVALAIAYWIFSKIAVILGFLVILVGYVAIIAIVLGAYAYIYRILSQKLSQAAPAA